MSAALDTALSAVTDAGPEPAANDVATRREAIARELYPHLTGYKIVCFDRPGYEDERIRAERFADRIIAADPATAQLAALQAECALKDEALKLFLQAVGDETFHGEEIVGLTPRARIDGPLLNGAIVKAKEARQALAAQPVEGAS